MSRDRDAFGNAADQRDFRIQRFEDRIRGKRWRDVDHAGVRAGGRNRFVAGVENRQIEVALPAFARRYPADHLRAIGNRLFRVEGALRAGKALADDLGGFVDEDCHSIVSVGQALARHARWVPG